jgi:hypothetical protein
MDRRALLRGAGLISLVTVVGGCSKKRVEELRPRADVAVLTGAIASEEHLVALYEAVRTAHSGLSSRLDPLLAHHRAHLSALRRHYRPGTYSTSPSPSPTASQAPPAVPGQVTQALAALRLAERQAAAARVKEVERVEPGFAQLLASIGACEAGHVVALGTGG